MVLESESLGARPPVPPCAPGDGLAERVLWALVALRPRRRGRRGPAARRAAWMRLAARTDAGYEKGRLRARRTPVPAPGLVRPPEAWYTTAPLVRTRRAGLLWELDLRDNLQRTLYFTGTYERGVARLLERELRAGDVVADVGAHVGVHALRAAARLRALGGGRVVAFEPTPDSAARLRTVAARNGVRVEVHELALGDRDGSIELRADARYGAHDAGVRSRFGEGPVVASVPQTTFGTRGPAGHAWTGSTRSSSTSRAARRSPSRACKRRCGACARGCS